MLTAKRSLWWTWRKTFSDYYNANK